MLRSERVNGEVYAFNRQTGKMEWHNRVEHQMVLLEQFQDLPMVLFTAKYTKVDARGLQRQTTGTRSIDKRTGKLIWPQPPRPGDPSDTESGAMPPQSHGQFHTLPIDRHNGVVDLVSNNMRLRHYVGNNGMPGLNGSAAPAINWDAQPRPVPLQPLRPMRPRLGGDGN